MLCMSQSVIAFFECKKRKKKHIDVATTDAQKLIINRLKLSFFFHHFLKSISNVSQFHTIILEYHPCLNVTKYASKVPCKMSRDNNQSFMSVANRISILIVRGKDAG